MSILSIPVIELQFEVSQFSADESDTKKEIQFNINHPIIVDTHFFVLAMTYQHFDDEYEALNSSYPGLKPYALNNEYDQAECKFLLNCLKYTI